MPSYRFWMDDWLILVAFAAFVASAAVSVLQAQAGAVEHIWFLGPDDITRLTKVITLLAFRLSDA
jgi:hypothetical protein